MESRLGTAEEDHSDKDDQIHTLKEEIEHQNNLISNFHFHEKKGGTESKQKNEEDIQSMEWSATTCLV